MDPREILSKLTELSKTEQPKAEPLNEAKKPNESGYFTNLVENMAQGQQKPIPVVGKQNDKTQTGVGFLNISDNSPAAQAMQTALSDMVKQNKAQIVMPTDPQNVPPQAGAQGQNAVKQQNQQGGVQPTQPLSEVESENFTMISTINGTEYEVEYNVDDDMVEIISVRNSFDGEADGDDISGLLSNKELDDLTMKAHEDYEMNQADHADYVRDREEDDTMVADYEQLDEISKDLAGKYIKRAATATLDNPNSENYRWNTLPGLAQTDQTSTNSKYKSWNKHKQRKRKDGIDLAIDKLSGNAKIRATESKDLDSEIADIRKKINKNKNKVYTPDHPEKKEMDSLKRRLDKLVKQKETTNEGVKDTFDKLKKGVTDKIATMTKNEKKETWYVGGFMYTGNGRDARWFATNVEFPSKKEALAYIKQRQEKLNASGKVGHFNLFSETTDVYFRSEPLFSKIKDGNKKESMKKVEEVLDSDEARRSYAKKNDKSHKQAWKDYLYYDGEGQDPEKKDAARHTATKRAKGLGSLIRKVEKDGNKKQTVKESTMRSNPKISAARHEGKTHGLRGHAYHGKSYEGLEEQQAYHEGYKEGLDECYGSMNETTMPSMPSMPSTPMMEDSNTASQLEAIGAEIIDLAHQAMDLVRGTSEEGAARSYWYPHILGAVSKDNSYGGGSMITLMDSVMALDAGDEDDEYLGEYEGEFDEGNAFIGKLASTRKGEEFELDGKTYTNNSDRFGSDVFEAWDNQLSDLLNEGLSVSVSQGNEHTPDQVSITATDQDAEELMGLVRNAGLGMFGGAEEPSVSEPMSVQPEGEPEEIGTGAIAIDVGDSDDMLGMLQKLGGIGNVDGIGGDEDYADEEEWGFGSDEQGSGDHEQLHGNHEDPSEEDEEETTEETCNECGDMMEANHVCEESDAETDEEAEAEEDKALAGADSGDEEELAESFFNLLSKVNSLSESEELTEWANQVGKGEGKGTKAQFTQDTEYMTQTIAGGLNKPKSTGQTTTPVITAQMDRTFDSVNDLSKLAGIKK